MAKKNNTTWAVATLARPQLEAFLNEKTQEGWQVFSVLPSQNIMASFDVITFKGKTEKVEE